MFNDLSDWLLHIVFTKLNLIFPDNFHVTGKALAVHTPTQKVTTCEILPHGKFIVLALDNHPNLVTLRLHGPSKDGTDDQPEQAPIDYVYGSKENEAKLFQL